MLQPSLRGVPARKIKKPAELGKLALSKGCKSLLVKTAKRLNKLWRRKGQVWAERYYAESISSRRKTWNEIAYVLNNAHHHGATDLSIDPYSSGKYFEGWEAPIAPPDEPPEKRPTVPARTWLLAEGWKMYGPIPFPVRR